MDVPRLVQCLNSLRDLVHEARHIAARHRIGQRQEVFHHVERLPTKLACAEKARQGRQRQEAKCVDLSQKPCLQVARVIDQELQRTLVTEPQVPHAVHFG